MVCVDITQQDIVQTCFPKYFSCLVFFSGVSAYFHLVGITVKKEQNLHHLEFAAGNRHLLLDPAAQVVDVTLCVWYDQLSSLRSPVEAA